MDKLTQINLLLAIPVALLSGCGTAKVRVSSTPNGATVLAVTPNGDEHPLGPTPLDVEASKLRETCKSSGSDVPCRLVVSKAGYARESVFVNSSFFKNDLVMKVTLEPAADWIDLEKSEAFLKRLTDVAHYSARLQEQTLRGDYNDAIETAREFVATHPKVSVAWDLLGNVYYLKGMYTQAMDAYRKSLSLNPGNTETQAIVRSLASGGRAAKGVEQ